MTFGCTRCGTPLPAAALAAESWTCVGCMSELEVWAFPALRQPPPMRPADAPAIDGEAVCFYHPQKRAAVVCDGCGRFLCTLCEVELGAGHYCPTCLEAGKTKTTATSLETQRTLWDRIAFAVAVLPMVLFYVTVVTAPIAIFLALRHWRTPGSIVKASRWRFVAALVVGVLQLVGMTLVFFGIYAALRAKAPQ